MISDPFRKRRALRTRRTTISAGSGSASFGLQWGRGLLVAALVAGLGLLLGGCGGGGTAQTEDEISLLTTDTPLREPVWVNKPNFAIALREDRPQVVKFNASAGALGGLGPGALDSSGELGGTVEKNMALNYGKEEQVYLPQPELGRVALVDTTNLREVRGFDVGGDPEWVAVHPGSQTLFALSKDGSTVTTLDLEDPKKTFDSKINAGEGARIETPERGLEPEFWIWGPKGISHYAGLPPELKVSMPINAAAFATDIEAAQRAYVGEGTSDRVVAVEGDPQGELDGKLRTVAEQDLGEKAEHLEAEEMRVIAATQNKLVEMRRENLAILDAVDFRSFLERQGLGDARASGMAVTGDRVYLTLEGEPYIVSIEKTTKTH